VGWAAKKRQAILEGLVNPFTEESEPNDMHDAMMALLFMVVVMFPCFLSAVTPE
jgi:hypothetical protein